MLFDSNTEIALWVMGYIAIGVLFLGTVWFTMLLTDSWRRPAGTSTLFEKIVVVIGWLPLASYLIMGCGLAIFLAVIFIIDEWLTGEDRDDNLSVGPLVL